MMGSRYILLAIAAGLAACTMQAQPRDRATEAVQPPPLPVNGNYSGMMQLIRGPSVPCGTQDMTAFQVNNGSVHYDLRQPETPWQPHVVFDAIIAPNGTFQAASGSAYLRGQLSQGHMQGEIGGGACGYTFEADREGTW